jgi:hypothetical protein
VLPALGRDPVLPDEVPDRKRLLAPIIPPTVGGIRPDGYDLVVLQL